MKEMHEGLTRAATEVITNDKALTQAAKMEQARAQRNRNKDELRKVAAQAKEAADAIRARQAGAQYPPRFQVYFSDLQLPETAPMVDQVSDVDQPCAMNS